jgi:hypothetical protein
MAPKSATNTIARGACAEDGNPAKNKNPASILSVFVSVVASILGVSPVFCQYGSPVFS